MEKLCPKCRRTYAPTDTFCPEDGTRLVARDGSGPNDTTAPRPDDVLDLIARLGSEMSKQFDPTPYDAPVRPASDTAHPTKEGLRLAMLLGSAIDLRDRNDVEGAKALVRQALALAPDNRGAKDMLAGLDRAP